MDIQELPKDSLNNIFNYINVQFLLKIMSTCRLFGSIIDTSIKNVTRDDFYECLFQIATLSVTTLKIYLRKVLRFDQNKFANLMLAAFTSNNVSFIHDIILYAFKRKIFKRKINEY